MSSRVNLAGRTAFRTVLATDIPTILIDGLVSPDLQIGRAIAELQRPDHARAQREKRLALPGRPRAGRFVHATHVVHTPLALLVASGHSGVTLRRNSELVHVELSPTSLDEHEVLHLFSDRSPWTAGVSFSFDPETLTLDKRFLASRDFRVGRNGEFGAGIVAIDPVPPRAVTALICSEETVGSRLREQVARAGLATPVVVDRGAFFWPPEQRA